MSARPTSRSSRARPRSSTRSRRQLLAARRRARRSSRSRTTGWRSSRATRILLIVEDDPHYARIIIDLARDKGFKVLVAMRGADALELAKQYQPTAVSLDVFLPDMLGWTVLSQLKQNPLTRHIPVQIITLDEDRQHGLARGAFSFVTKPTTTEGVEAALARIKEYAKPRRKRLLVVEDNAAEQMSIRELLGHDDIEIVTAGTGAEALDILREQPCDCVVLDLRLPDMSGFEVLERIRDDDVAVGRAGRGVHRPRAVGRGGRAAAHHGAQHRGQGRGIARAAARRDRAVPAPRRHRPAAREAAHAGAAQQLRRGSGRPDRAAGRRRRAQHLRAVERAGAPRHAGADRDHRQRGDRAARNRRRTSRSC